MSEPDSVSEITHITDHESRGVEKLTDKYASKPLLAAYTGVFLRALQEVEDAFWAMLIDSIDTAVSKRLDRIGKIVGFKRGSLGDEPYRIILRAWILANRSDGSGEALLGVMAAMLVGFGTFVMDEYPRMFVLVEPSVATPYYDAMIRVLRRAKMGGVRVQMLYYTESRGAFKFNKERLLPQVDPGHGLGDVNDESVGGVLVGVIE